MKEECKERRIRKVQRKRGRMRFKRRKDEGEGREREKYEKRELGEV